MRGVQEIKKWGEFVKFSHTIFALPFALASMVLAARTNRGWPGWSKFSLILAAMVCARTCAMAFNRIADRHWDRLNPRTAGRHLPSGAISLASAWTLCLGSATLFLAVTYWINWTCFLLAPVALAVVCFYSLTKRFTDFTHVYLGMALALAPIGAWLAVKGSFHFLPIQNGSILFSESALLPLLLALAVVFWLIGFDIIYALQDYDFDREQGLHSLVVRWGSRNAMQAAFISHVVMVMILSLLGLLAGFRIAYIPGMAIILMALMLEHWIARRRSLNWVQSAFFRLNALISVIFLVTVVAEVAFPFFRLR